MLPGPSDENSWTMRAVLRWSARYLTSFQPNSPRLDAEWLLCHLLNAAPVDLLKDDLKVIPQAKRAVYLDLLERRAAGEPVAYIIQSKDFYGREFFVTPAVLIPRPETETIVDEILKTELPSNPVILDVGTGSGCLAVTLAKEIQGAEVLAWDVSSDALEVAKKNAERLSVQVQFFLRDALQPSNWAHLSPLDVVVSNPPYIAFAEKDSLAANVKDFEPALALFAPTGLEFYKAIAQEARKRLKSEGKIFLEIGYQQAQAVCRILHDQGWREIKVTPDLAGLDRVVSART